MDNIDWDNIYVQLYAYADQLLKNRVWFRKGKPDSFLKGKQAHDYAIDAIEKYLLAPEKYNPSTGRSLITYLKWHIIRSSIGNDVRSTENAISSDIFAYNRDGEESDNFDAMLPMMWDNFDENIDYTTIIREIENEIQQDNLAKLIFEEVRCNGIKRRDFMKQYQLKENDYDNAMKRLKTILKKVAKQYVL